MIRPTIVHNVTPQDPIMQEEIFGPVIAVLEYETIDEAFDIILDLEKPLAGYVFTHDQAIKDRFLAEIPFGSGAINDAVVQVSNPHLPFGGVGNSGMGRPRFSMSSSHGCHQFPGGEADQPPTLPTGGGFTPTQGRGLV